MGTGQSPTRFLGVPRRKCKCLTMKRIGISELRRNAGTWVRRVQKRESIEITRRGQLVAMLVPLPEDGVWTSEGGDVLRPSVGNAAEIAAGDLTASEALEVLRGASEEEVRNARGRTVEHLRGLDDDASEVRRKAWRDP